MTESNGLNDLNEKKSSVKSNEKSNKNKRKPANEQKRKKYSPSERENAIRLVEALGNTNLASEQTGIPYATISEWVQKDKLADKPEEVISDRLKFMDEFQRAIIEEGSEVGKKILSEIHRRITEDPKGIAFRDLSTVLGTIYDKSALASGGSTSNTAIKIELSPEVKAMAK